MKSEDYCLPIKSMKFNSYLLKFEIIKEDTEQ